jgi:hypothetical protein
MGFLLEGDSSPVFFWKNFPTKDAISSPTIKSVSKGKSGIVQTLALILI